MYGLEHGKKHPNKFMFDLEKELKEQPKRAKELMEKAEKRVHDLKHALREGATEKGDFDKLGILLHAYTALEKVLKKAVK